MKPIDFAEYAAIDAVNWSTLKEMRRSPLHYRHRVEQQRSDSPRLALGRAVHTAVLEPDKLPIEYAVYNGGIRRGKEWEAFAHANRGRTIIKLDEYDRCLAIRDAVRNHPVAAPYLESGMAEVSIAWIDEASGLKCKARIDFVCATRPAFVDLKSTKDVDSRRFATTAARYGYHLQAAFYREALRATGTAAEPLLIAVESEPPYDVAVFELDPDDLYAADAEVRQLLARVVECRAANAWPGRLKEATILQLPLWVYGDDEEAGDLGLVFGKGAGE